MIYLDYNATAPLRSESRAAMLLAMDEGGNASSVHAAGRRARGHVEKAREIIAAAAGVSRDEVVFTSGGTESNHLALHGIEAASFFVSAIEHDSVLKSAPASAQLLPVLPSGIVDLLQAEKMIAAASRPALVSLMWVNNETGVIQPVEQMLEICNKYGAMLHVDAVQALGRIAIDDCKIPLLSLSAHKVGGPMGVGALSVREGVKLTAQQRGGGQERGLRAGTENVAGLAGLGAAVEVALRELPEFQRRSLWRDAFEAELLKVPGAIIAGKESPRVANTTCVLCPGIASALLLIQIDLQGISASAGSACSSGKVIPSHVLKAMDSNRFAPLAQTRFSFGWQSYEEQLKKAAETWTELAISAIR